MKTSTQTTYVSNDGEVFISEGQCLMHEGGTLLEEWADRHNLCSGGEWNSTMVLGLLEEYSDEVGAILRNISRGRVIVVAEEEAE